MQQTSCQAPQPPIQHHIYRNYVLPQTADCRAPPYPLTVVMLVPLYFDRFNFQFQLTCNLTRPNLPFQSIWNLTRCNLTPQFFDMTTTHLGFQVAYHCNATRPHLCSHAPHQYTTNFESSRLSRLWPIVTPDVQPLLLCHSAIHLYSYSSQYRC